MQAIEFSATAQSGILQIPEAYRKEWEGLPVRVILLPDKQELAKNKPKTLLERLKTVEKIHAAPDLSENHDTHISSQSDA